MLASHGVENCIICFAMNNACKFISGELLDEELIPWLVGVERVNDVVTVVPGVRTQRVGLCVASRIGIARHIKPVSGPAFTVGRGGKQAIDQPFVGGW